MAADYTPDALGEFIGDELAAIQSDVIQTKDIATAIPLLGNQLPENLQIFSSSLLNDLSEDLESLPHDATHLQIQSALQSIFYGNGISVQELIVDEDFEVTFQLTGTGLPQTLVSADTQLGIPFLPISVDVDVEVQAEVGFEFAPITIGYDSAANDFFHEFGSNSTEELVVSLELTLAEDSQAASFGLADFATVTNQGSLVSVELGIDLDGGTSVVTISPEIDIALSVETDVNPDATGDLPQLPKFSFDLNWETSGTSWSGEDVHLDNFQIELGGLLNTIVGPVLEHLEPVLDPVMTAISKLDEPLPLLSDVVGQDISLLNAMELLNQHVMSGEYKELIEMTLSTLDLISSFEAFDCEDGDCMIDLGDFSLTGNTLQSEQAGLLSEFDGDPLSTIGVDGLNGFDVNQIANQIDHYLDDTPLEDFGEQLQRQLKSLNNGVGIEFPIIDQPENLLLLLLGQPGAVDLFSMEAFFAEGVNDYQEGFQTPFHAGLHAGLTYDIDPIVNFRLGYDATGLFNAIGYQDASYMADGLWVGKVDADYPLGIELGSSVGAQLGVSHLVFDAYIEGEITADLTLAVPETADDDGKIRLSTELGPTLFEISGGIGGAINVGYEVGFKAFGYCVCTGQEWTLASTPTAGFNVSAIPNPFDKSGSLDEPNLAVRDGDQLVLSVGEDRINNDRNINPELTAEQFHVAVDDGKVIVSFGGVEESFALDGLKAIYAHAGDDNDQITIDSSVPVNVLLHGGVGNDVLIYSGTGDAELYGDEGNDALSSAGVVNVLHGGTGLDQLTGSSHPDATVNELEGGEGNDLLFGGRGVNNLRGGGGADQLHGGGGVNHLEGGSGADILIGGEGETFFDGSVGNDRYYAGAGAGVIEDTGVSTDADKVHWEVGDGDLVIERSDGRTGLFVLGSELDEAFVTRDATSNPQHIAIDAPDDRLILAKYIETLGIDGGSGADVVTVDSLSSPTLETIGINGSDKLSPDGDEDQIYVAATEGPDELSVSAHDAVLQIDDHHPTLIGATMVVDGLPYLVTVMSNPEDLLQVDTYAGDDFVDLYGTTGGLQINTHDGDDVITLFVDEYGNEDFSNPVPLYQVDVQVDAGEDLNKIVATSHRSSLADQYEFLDQRLASDRFAVDYQGEGFVLVGLLGSQADDTVQVLSTRADATNLIRGGEGDDSVLLGRDQLLEEIRGVVEVEGQAGANELVLDDRSASSGNNNVVVGGGVVSGLAGENDLAVVEYTDLSVTLLGSTDQNVDEVFQLEGPLTSLHIDGGGGGDTLVGDLFSNVWHVAGVDTGSVLTAGGSVGFEGVKTLQGNDAEDYFIMHPEGQWSGSIDGGGGADVLSYALYQTPVTVDLAAATATNVGGLSNLESVWGGSGDDRIWGDEGDNVLDGGGGNDVLVGRGGADSLFGNSGRDLLIGGTDSDGLYGGDGEDILIGGTTVHDDDADNLDAIMSEWTYAKHKRARRIDFLNRGGGLNGKVRLNDAAVFDDDAVDQLMGQDGLDLFFVAVEDLSDDGFGEA